MAKNENARLSAEELSKLSADELKAKLDEHREELMHGLFKHAPDQL